MNRPIIPSQPTPEQVEQQAGKVIAARKFPLWVNIQYLGPQKVLVVDYINPVTLDLDSIHVLFGGFDDLGEAFEAVSKMLPKSSSILIPNK